MKILNNIKLRKQVNTLEIKLKTLQEEKEIIATDNRRLLSENRKLKKELKGGSRNDTKVRRKRTMEKN